MPMANRRNRHARRGLATVLLALSVIVAGCGQPKPPPPAVDYDASVATAWFDLLLDLVQHTPGYTPPVASRAFAYAGITLYEAVAPGMPGYQSLVGQLSGLPPLPQPTPGEVYHWPTVANSALATLVRKFFSHAPAEHLAAINSLEDQFVYRFRQTLEPPVFSRSAGHGQLIGYAIYIWSTSDGGLDGELRNFPTYYTPPSGPGKWTPTAPKYQSAMLPSWGGNRLFALQSGSECDPGAPLPYSEEPASAFYQEALEVYNTVTSLTPEQSAIARFWADDPGATATPPGHSISILSQVLKNRNASLDVAAEAYAKVGMAVADAFIGCWRAKYEHNLIRPISYIQNVIDPNWTSPVTTPPFPEYTSGHSVQSAAAAQVMTDLFGEDFVFTDHTHDKHGLEPRTFHSFFDAANEAAISRLYGGIHFRTAIEKGLEQGKCIGQKVSAIRFKK